MIWYELYGLKYNLHQMPLWEKDRIHTTVFFDRMITQQSRMYWSQIVLSEMEPLHCQASQDWLGQEDRFCALELLCVHKRGEQQEIRP